MIGRTLSLIGSSGVSRWTPSQYSYSFLEKRYFVLGKVGTQRPFSSRVFQPTWSPCRCVHMTLSMLSMVTPAAWSACIQLLSLLRCQVGQCGKDLVLPMQASTKIV